MAAGSRDLTPRMVDLLEDTADLTNARDMCRLLASLVAEVVAAEQVTVQVLNPGPDRFATAISAFTARERRGLSIEEIDGTDAQR